MNSSGKRWIGDKRTPLADQVYADLRKRIVSLELSPSSSLSRQELSAYYGVSQTPLRDAIQRLEAEGLLDIFPQSKTVVTMIDDRLVRECQFLRTALETEIVALLAADPDKSKIESAQESLARMEWVLARDRELEEFERLDKQFHRGLFVAADKQGLHDLVESRSGPLDRLRRLHLHAQGERKPEKVIADHNKIIEMIRESKVEEAKDAMREHLSGTLARLETLKQLFPDHFPVPGE
ncbi:GntR family transcriptional regulator [Hwanghaeella sp.]|uniref:GntR family transcriptional regulator n=1 Tax=Hwanghaeella sp. TaxID=2605943 RepID=UPI003CCC2AC0